MANQPTNQELAKIAEQAAIKFKGNANELESAIGLLFVGQQYGWKVMLLVHDKKTIRKYEKILDVSIREIMPDVGPKADKSLAWNAVQKVSNFWKAVKGEITGIRSPQIK